ncbi:N-acetyltransferase, putative [Psychroflexus torquis ATCC 700755]|uniref:N-acetyltransferase, putative n=1 Tax=Psychroflexus torquis (strain ATCC 700755 / CIP 106069 / ACAM 623) TaxID=313595 RepID=K4IJT1_PSYTT|nr:GNAT family N-acetyltransferase [Psychroflexus torquis]AFU70594.1 N-acetyltransferase, putative [Psychroflexus torquis ATCC 700755]
MKIIEFKVGIVPKTSEIIEVYDSSGIKRPTSDSGRIRKMYENSNLIITAWLNNELIGISRSITDFCYACYLSDLAVKSEYQKDGIGKRLIELTQKEIGKETALILLSASIAMEYYPKIGFEKVENGFIIRRTK